MTLATFLNNNVLWIVLLIILLYSLYKAVKWFIVPSNYLYVSNIFKAIFKKKNIEEPQEKLSDKPNNSLEEEKIIEEAADIIEYCSNCKNPLLESQETVAIGNYRVHKKCAREMRKEARKGV